MRDYLGVYSETIATTRIGTEVSLKKSNDPKVLGGLSFDKFSKSDRHTFTKDSLVESDLNVAKIRVVSTIPNKNVAEEIRGKAYIGFILTEVQESQEID